MKEILDFILTFSSILWEALPFIILGAVIAGILEEFLPQSLITRILPKQVFFAVMLGALLGLIFPMCECGIVVVMRRLLKKGLPLACCIAYMLAGPIINPIVIGSTFIAFRNHELAWEMVGLRILLAFITATATAMIVHGQYRKYGNSLLTAIAIPKDHSHDDHEHHPVKRKSILDRLGNISSTAIHDFVDITVFLILGAVLAALAKTQITPSDIEWFSAEQPYLAIPAMMGLAFLMCLCSEADAFVAASFTTMHVSAKLAFLVLGPMLDIKLLMMYTSVFRPRLILTIVTSVVILVLILCMGVHVVYQANEWSGLPPTVR